MHKHHQVFTDEQEVALDAKLDPRLISEREGANKKKLSYIQGHTAIDQADRIFGKGNWNHRTLSCEPSSVIDPRSGEVIGIMYTAMVELTVRGCIGPTIEPGYQPAASVSVQDLIDTRRRNWKPKDREKPVEDWEIDNARRTIMESHEQAGKGAATDGLKRCLRVYGNQFANSLYGDGRVDIEDQTSKDAESSNQEGQNNGNAAQQPKTANQGQAPAKLTIEEDKAALSLFEKYATQQERDAFFKSAGIEVSPEGDLKSIEYRKAAMKLALYPATASMKEAFIGHTKEFTTERLKAFQDRTLGKALDELTAPAVARALDDLSLARFFTETAKIFDTEYKELQAIGAKFADGKHAIEHPLDIFGHAKQSAILNGYFGKLKTAALANKEAVEKFPEDVKANHKDRVALLVTSKKSA
jgi:DNA repair and recombination protein RAD52